MFYPAGDAHRLYRRLRRRYPGTPPVPLPELDHLREIHRFYTSLDPDDLRLLLAWLKKERKGVGMIPVTLPAVIWFAFLFSSTIEKTVTERWPLGWVVLLALWVPVVLITVYVHFRERAWTDLHIALAEDALRGHSRWRRQLGSARQPMSRR